MNSFIPDCNGPAKKKAEMLIALVDERLHGMRSYSTGVTTAGTHTRSNSADVP